MGKGGWWDGKVAREGEGGVGGMGMVDGWYGGGMGMGDGTERNSLTHKATYESCSLVFSTRH